MQKRYGQDIPVDFVRLTVENAHYLNEFCCDNEALDHYFRSKAVSDQEAVSYLFIDASEEVAIACITIACSAIFSVSEEEQFSTILPAMEVLYFGVDEHYQHLTYAKGGRLTLSHYIFSFMLDWMKQRSVDTIGAAKIVLYSVPEAIHFYERCYFKKFGDTMYGDEGYFVDGCIPMYYDLNQ